MTSGNPEDIVYRKWVYSSPSVWPQAAFLMVHGLGAHAGRWEAMAGFFARYGISSYALELRGDSGFGGYYRDILKLRDVIKKDDPSAKMFLVGESMGALIAFLLAASRPGLFNGLICISPAFANRIGFPVSGYLKIAAALLFSPGRLFAVPFDSSMCTRDLDYRKKMDADPAERRTATARLLAAILFAQARARHVRSLGLPALFLVPGEDRIVDHRATRSVFNGLADQDKRLVEFPGMYHALSIDTGKEAVFDKIFGWLKGRIA